MQRGSSDLSQVISLLKAADQGKRDQAVIILGEIDFGEAGQTILDAIHKSDVSAARSIIHTVGQSKNPGKARVLSSALHRHRFELRGAAAEELGRVNDPVAVPSLVQLLKHEENPGVKMTAFWAVEKITGERFSRDKERLLAWYERNKQRFESRP